MAEQQWYIKIKNIVLSRFQREKKDPITLLRREICKGCPFNTKNLQKIPLKQKLIGIFSRFYTWITFSEYEELGECNECGCTIYHKTRIHNEKCPKNKWVKTT